MFTTAQTCTPLCMFTLRPPHILHMCLHSIAHTCAIVCACTTARTAHLLAHHCTLIDTCMHHCMYTFIHHYTHPIAYIAHLRTHTTAHFAVYAYCCYYLNAWTHTNSSPLQSTPSLPDPLTNSLLVLGVSGTLVVGEADLHPDAAKDRKETGSEGREQPAETFLLWHQPWSCLAAMCFRTTGPSLAMTCMGSTMQSYTLGHHPTARWAIMG